MEHERSERSERNERIERNDGTDECGRMDLVKLYITEVHQIWSSGFVVVVDHPYEPKVKMNALQYRWLLEWRDIHAPLDGAPDFQSSSRTKC
jgi:hypothetical protein